MQSLGELAAAAVGLGLRGGGGGGQGWRAGGFRCYVRSVAQTLELHDIRCEHDAAARELREQSAGPGTAGHGVQTVGVDHNGDPALVRVQDVLQDGLRPRNGRGAAAEARPQHQNVHSLHERPQLL